MPAARQTPTSPVPAGPVPAGPVPAGPVPAGPVPAGPVPAGPVPAGPAPADPVAAGPEVLALSFEDALAELERIVRGLEGGQQKLEDAIGAYERGARLRAHCEAKLAEAEARVQAIVAAADGSVTLRPAD